MYDFIPADQILGSALGDCLKSALLNECAFDF